MTREQAEQLRAPIAHAEADAALAVAHLLCAHGAQGTIGGLAVVLGKMLAHAHQHGLLEGSLAENMGRVEALTGLGVQEQVQRRGVVAQGRA